MRLLRSRWSLAATLVTLIGCSSSGGDGGGGDTPADTGTSTTDTAVASDGAADDTGAGADAGDGGGAEDSGGTPDGAADGAADGGGSCTIAGCGADSDCDGISDTLEGRFASGAPLDTDKDGTPDYLDDDSDGDGIPDKLEWRKAGCAATDDENDADGDGVPNFQDTDSDGNGLPDKDEVCPPAAVLTKLAMPACTTGTPYDFDGDGTPDYLDFDNDHDSSKADKTLGLSDKTELADDKGVYVGLSLDTDSDGIPDLYDVDSDGDFILDLDDGTTDDDGDGKKAFRDTDSDGDAVPDACEARGKAASSAADLTLPLLDTDTDGVPDYRDLDSDGDLLADGKEDTNGNCIVDTSETARLKADTDGDGIGDLVEVVLLGVEAAKDASATPAKSGKFYFVVPYSLDGSAKPTPTSATLAMSTKLQKGDVAFIVDTTFSMEEEIAVLKSSLSTKIIPELGKRFTDLGIGVAAFDDFPTASESLSSTGVSLPFYIPTGGEISTDVTKAPLAASALSTHPGGKIPESQIPAMMRALTGAALTWPEGSIAADTSAPAGTYGAMRFREGALPILVPITDASMHNGKRALNTTPTGASTDYATTFHDAYSFTTPNLDELVTKINELGAKVIGVASSGVSRTEQLNSTAYPNAPYPDLAYLADKTGSYVPPSAFPGGALTGCKTDPFGSPIYEYTDGIDSSCRLVFRVDPTNGNGLNNAIVDGVGALLNAISFDVYVRAYKDPADTTTVDPVDAFMTSLQPLPTGGTDPVTGGVCEVFGSSALKDKYRTPKALAGAGDISETIGGLNPGKLYCFAVNPKANTTVLPKTTPQQFKAFLTVQADKPAGGSITLGTDREVLFIVPPTLN